MTSSKVMAAGPGIWSQALIKSPICDVSFATIQANSYMEDASQVVVGPEGFFVTVNDGHGGAEASHFATDNLYKHLQVYSAEEGSMGVPALQRAYAALEASFTELVSRSFEEQPRLACVGTCSLSGLISGDGDQLIVANLGDTRAVLGTSTGGGVKSADAKWGMMRAHGDDDVIAVQLSTDHNVNVQEERRLMEERFPEDKEVVVDARGSYRVKGRIQVTRTIGDVYMKHQEFNQAPLPASIQLKEPITIPYLLSEPAIHVRTLRPGDQFAIFATDGLWDLLSNQEVVDIVAHHSKEGIAKRLIRTGLERVAKRIDVKYAELERLSVGQRRNLHDDISVVVVFFKSFPKIRTNIPLTIVKGGEEAGSHWGEPPSPRGNLRLHTTKNRLMHSLACSCCMVDD